MPNNQSEHLLQQLIRLRGLTSLHLPIGHSFIPYDILLAVAHASLSNDPLTVKALFTALPYSDMGLRYHYRRLVASGWIGVKSSSKDKRNRALVPSLKLMQAFESITKTANFHNQ